LREDHCDGLGNCLPICPAGAISFAEASGCPGTGTSCLNQWPVQIKLVPAHAPYFANADLLIAADCSAYAYGNFHADYMRGKITVIGCPKLDDGDYAEKLTAILSQNEVQTVTVTRMEVPCCGGIEAAARTALKRCGKSIPFQVITISTDGS
jgi:ferredoxin